MFRRPLQWRHAIQYPLVYVLQYGLGITLTTALIEGLHLHAEFVPALVIVLTLPFTFWLGRFGPGWRPACSAGASSPYPAFLGGVAKPTSDAADVFDDGGCSLRCMVTRQQIAAFESLE